MNNEKRPLALIILDGWGVSENEKGNAIAQAETPNIKKFMANYPYTALECSGLAVGLPEGQMGNSEVGHLNMGAGRVVYQELTRITKSIKDGDFFSNPELVKAAQKAKENNAALHIMGLLSDGGVHSHIKHIFAALRLAARQGLTGVYFHAFLDGRDVPPASAKGYMRALLAKMKELGVGQVATVSGRYYAMDRDRRWERTEQAYRAMVYAEGLQANSPVEAIDVAYERGETDEFVKPTVITDEHKQPVARIADGDSVIFINFRPDRARQITRAFVDDDFTGFNRGPGRPRVHFVCMTVYDKTIEAPVAFPPHQLVNTLGEWLSKQGLKQLRLAETEKYAHVTFFFNGGVEPPNPNEERILIPSPKVATYDLKPEMSANEITDAFLANLQKGTFDVIITNFANPDMVGHTGDLEATKSAIETVDKCLGRIVPAMLEKSGTVIITADHGNAEKMRDDHGGPYTAHTTDPVPFVLVSDRYKGAKLREGGSLPDIAPTMLDILGLPKPPEMTGESLLKSQG
ncbi:2,3-bisphosphoglycerate-independent phosphoglycerate mutase [Desulfotomaculum nigrificans CO-1-SRB]|uniref:2,3-bisphosphoglycerate-independent phosphoglycerate mutase n=1 Tax=Desulfotomaculum nigrificans (strain DSM 14880 / VKM B-2319 / CO-1-SRB) TaxID=868595 RepID=F6B4K9_DESCC|nr:2,3-bisphosphoglycerate-independent phosphoglycerate mutase [Desulfotomaculum nigrificans]AEF93032.1 2,3-bisphosphoglycerate-independent phosphoglycerate mutase [Desulfotomaculum nigrificans CO-1-SRB]